MARFSQAKAMTKKVVRKRQRRERISPLAPQVEHLPLAVPTVTHLPSRCSKWRATAVQKPRVTMAPVRENDDLGVLTAPTLIW